MYHKASATGTESYRLIDGDKTIYRYPMSYVVHFLSMLTQAEQDSVPNSLDRISTLYNMACAKAAPLGGRRHHVSSFGGGIAWLVDDIDPEQIFDLMPAKGATVAA